MSRDRHIDTPAPAELVAGKLGGLTLPQAIEQYVTQSLRISSA